MDFSDIIITQLAFVLLVLLFDSLLAVIPSFKWNRGLLLSIPFLSGIVLFVNWLPSDVEMVAVYQFELPLLEVGNATNSTNTISASSILLLVYMSVVGGMLLHALYSIWRQYTNGYASGESVNGFPIRMIQSASSYSFISRIYLSEADFRNNLIRQHECAHLRQKHWLDTIFAQLVVCLFWFNPIVWRWRKLIQQNHEFLADHEVARQRGLDLKDYIHLLLDKALETKHFSIENYFSMNSLISKRITMLNTENRKRPMRWVIGGALALTGMIYLGACAKKADTNTSSQKTEEVIEKEINEEMEVYKVVEEMPEFTGGNEALYKYLGENLKYPEECKEDAVEGIVYISFIINTNGDVIDVKAIKGVHDALDMEAMRVISEMPKWVPGKNKGEAVNVQYTMPIRFKMDPPLPPPPPSEE